MKINQTITVVDSYEIPNNESSEDSNQEEQKQR